MGIYELFSAIGEEALATMKKRMLIYAHYYVPDVASTGQLLRELAEGMLDTFDVTVICVVPSYTGKIASAYKTQRYYRETINGVQVLRIRVPEFRKSNKFSRVINILSYLTGAVHATFAVGPQDYIFSISQPPILGGLIGVFGKWLKHAKYIYNIQDFNPEQTIAVGYFKNRLLLRMMMKLDKFSCRHADLVITVGRDLIETLKIRFYNGKIPKHVMINNWINEKEIYPLSQENEGVINFRQCYGLSNKFVIMYSGNIGLYYDLKNLIKVIQKFNPQIQSKDGREIVFAFVGEGSILNELKQYKSKHHLDNVVFIPYQKKEDLIYSMNAADLHWCVNADGIKGVSCPSKFYGIAAVGKPVLGVLEDGSEIQMLIDQIKCGRCAAPGDYQKIKENIQWFIDHAGTEEIKQMGRNGRNYLVTHLSKDISIEKYKKCILEN